MRVGVLGVGQLARMMALSGIPLGLAFVFYGGEPSATVQGLGDCVFGAYDDLTALNDFFRQVDVVTYENENIPISTVAHIQTLKPIYPPISGLEVMQDRLLEKGFFNQLAIPTNVYHRIDQKADLIALCHDHPLPIVLKKRSNSYDGKGQVIINSIDQLSELTEAQCAHCIAEAFVPFDREVSLIGCRDQVGNFLFYDLCENTHKNGTLIHTRNQPDDPLFESAKGYLTQVMETLSYVGICTLEFFEVNGQLLANELAPRVHNSGHWTIEGSVTSQFENHLRSILGWPLGSTRSYGHFSMYNILSQMPDAVKILSASEAIRYHDYQKEPELGRKLGHVTLPVDHMSFEASHKITTIITGV